MWQICWQRRSERASCQSHTAHDHTTTSSCEVKSTNFEIAFRNILAAALKHNFCFHVQFVSHFFKLCNCSAISWQVVADKTWKKTATVAKTKVVTRRILVQHLLYTDFTQQPVYLVLTAIYFYHAKLCSLVCAWTLLWPRHPSLFRQSLLPLRPSSQSHWSTSDRESVNFFERSSKIYQLPCRSQSCSLPCLLLW